MFGVIAAGRLVQTNFEQLSETRLVTTIPDAEKVNHLVVFMTGSTPFPEELGGAVYFSWNGEQGPNWQLLGFISNQKPSAIFKIAHLKTAEVVQNPFTQGMNGGPVHVPGVAQIGISVEPVNQISGQTPAAHTCATSTDTFMHMSGKMVEHLFNYVSSFALSQAQMTPNPSETYVPLSSLQQWYMNFKRRMEQDPSFLKS